MLYFLLIKLKILNHIYQSPLESFTTFFLKAVGLTQMFDFKQSRVL
jgi:hypothetical protein